MENAREFVQQCPLLLAGEFGAFVFGEGGGDGGDGVHGGEFGEEFLAKVLAEDAADAVADGGAADVFFRHDESEARGSAFFPAAVCFDARPLYFSSAAGGELKIFAPRERAVFRFQGSDRWANGAGGRQVKRRRTRGTRCEGGTSGRRAGRTGGEGGRGWVGVSGGESGASFAAAGVEDGASVPRRHSRAKTVSALAANVGGLVGAFHCRNRRGMNVWNSAGKRNYTQFPLQLTIFSEKKSPPSSRADLSRPKPA